MRFISILVLSLLGLHQAQGETLTLSQYYQSLQDRSLERVEAESQLRIADINVEEADSFYQSRLSSNISRSRVEQGPEETFNTSYDITWEQSLRTGTAINSRWSEENFGLFNQRNRSLTVSQSLWKNFLGKSNDLRQESIELGLEASKSQIERTKLQVCNQAAQEYAEVMLNQKLAKISKARLKSSLELSKRIERLYKDNLVRKIDLLNTQDSHLSNELLLHQAKATLNQGLVKLSASVGRGVSAVSDIPKVSESELTLTKTAIHPDVKALQDTKASQQKTWEFSKIQSDLDVGAFISRQDSQSDISPTRQALIFGLQLSYDFNPAPKAEQKRSFQAIAASEERLAITKRNLEDRRTEITAEINDLRSFASLLAKRKVLAGKKLKEAKRHRRALIVDKHRDIDKIQIARNKPSRNLGRT